MVAAEKGARLTPHPSAGKCVIVESPYSPGPKPKDPCTCTAMNVLNMTDCSACEALGAWREKLLENITYGRACMADCLARGEAPFASHLLYTQAGVLDDDVLAQRTWGIQAGFFWRSRADKTVVYTDRGTSKGMQLGIDDAVKMGHAIEYRTLNKDVK